MDELVAIEDDDVVSDGNELHGRSAGRFRPLTSLPLVVLALLPLIFGFLTHCHASPASSSSSNDEIMRGVGGRYKSLKFNPHDESGDDVHPMAKSSVTSADVRRLLIDAARDWPFMLAASSAKSAAETGNSSQLNNDLVVVVCNSRPLSACSSLTAGWWSRLAQSDDAFIC